MAAPRFFVPEPLDRACVGTTIELPSAVAHHATRVLRHGVGAALTLFDGTGGEYAVELVAVDKRGASVRVDAFDPVERESPLAVTRARRSSPTTRWTTRCARPPNLASLRSNP